MKDTEADIATLINLFPCTPGGERPKVIRDGHKVNGVGVGWDLTELKRIAMIPAKTLAERTLILISFINEIGVYNTYKIAKHHTQQTPASTT